MNFVLLYFSFTILFRYTQPQVVDVKNIFYKAFEFPDVTEECVKQLNETRRKLSEEWALKMIDASSKLPSGLLYGNFIDYGHYDECMEIKHEYNSNDVIKGKYCFGGVIVNVPLPSIKIKTKEHEKQKAMGNISLPIILSICIPNKCKPSDLKSAAKRLGVEKFVKFNDEMCQVDEPIIFNRYDIVAICLFSILGILVVLCTSYDTYLRRTGHKPKHIVFISFSIYSNVLSLLKTHNNSSVHLSCLNGLRVISMAWVVIGHRAAYYEQAPAINHSFASQLKTKTYSQYFQGAPLAVDTFLFITGCLITFHFLKTQTKPGAKFNLIIYYVHRYLRLTPALFGTYIFVISLAHYVGHGPLSPLVSKINEPCFKWWWSVFLYIQNYTNMHEVCMVQTWYLAMDMQIFILTPLILVPLIKWSNKAMYGLGFIILIAAAIPGPITYIYSLQMLTQDYYDYYYYLTHTRLAAYLIGMMTGVMLFRYRNRKIRMNTVTNLSIWFIVLAGMGAIVFTMNDITYNFDRIKSSIYITLHRPLWAIGLGWITFASFKGNGGVINWFLSLPIFEIWAKLTYSMFLLHTVVIFITIGSSKQPIYVGNYDMLREHWADLVITTGLAFLWVLLFESPIIILEKAIFGTRQHRQRTATEQSTASSRSTN